MSCRPKPASHPSSHQDRPAPHLPTRLPTHLANSSPPQSSSFTETHTMFIIDNKQRILNLYFQDHTRSLASATHEEWYHVSLLCGPRIIPHACHPLYRSGCLCVFVRGSLGPSGVLTGLGVLSLCPSCGGHWWYQ